MAGNLKNESSEEIHKLSIEIKQSFSLDCGDKNKKIKWCLLKDYKSKYVREDSVFSQNIASSYHAVCLTLLDCLRANLFCEKWQEDLYDSIFLEGVHHESFMILVRRLSESCESYEQQKVINLLQKFLQNSKLEPLLLCQCISNGDWKLQYISSSRIWNDLITFLISLPERVASKTKGQMNKIFCPQLYIPLLMSSVWKVLSHLHNYIAGSQDCSLEFLGNLIGRLCGTGHADKVVKKLCSEFVKILESDFIWRRIAQNLITKIPFSSLESFITNVFLVVPWYGYIDWILGEEGVKNQKLNYILTVKLLLFCHFKQELILQNIVGYFASSKSRVSCFWKLLDALLKCWADASTLRYQSFHQQYYAASALMVCAGWVEKVNADVNTKAFMEKVLLGTQLRIGSSEKSIRNLGMIVGDKMAAVLDPKAPKFEFEHEDATLLNNLTSLMQIPSKPERNNILYLEDLNFFEEFELENEKVKDDTVETPKPKVPHVVGDLDSDDDLEPYDMSHDVPKESKRPLYLRDCMLGLIEQNDSEWTEQCLKYAESLIKTNSDIVHEVAVEMTKIMLHLEDQYSTPNFISTRYRILIALTVHCPVLVANYLTSQFYEKDYNIRQRLDVLEVLAAASQELSHPQRKVIDFQPNHSKDKIFSETDQQWKLIIDKRVEAKTRLIRKLPEKSPTIPQENKFAAVAGHFFSPLLEKYDKQNQMLRLLGDDSYVLGRLIYSLGIIMHSAENIPLSRQMGTVFLQFLVNVRNHEDCFVRQASIFALATIYVSVPGYILVSDVLPDVLESQQWLQSVIDNDPDIHCQMKASHALGLIMGIMKEEMPLVSELINA